MLSQKFRISDRKVFDLLKQKGKSVGTSKFVFVYMSDSALENSKFGVIASKKISKLAVTRNRIRRIIYAALDKYVNDIKVNIYGLFIVRTDFSETKSTEVEKEIESVFKKSGII